MSYKVKSLFYFVCFLIASIAYYYIDRNEIEQGHSSQEITKMETQTISAKAFTLE